MAVAEPGQDRDQGLGLGNIDPIVELVDDGVGGSFWPLGDPARVTAVLLELVENEPNRLKPHERHRKRFERDADANVVGPRLRSFLLDRRS